MGVTEQAGGIVQSITEGLKQNPSCLAAVLLAAMMALLTFYAQQEQAQRSHDQFMAALQVCPYLPPERRISP